MILAAKVMSNLEYTCGSQDFVFTGTIPKVVSTIILLIKIAIPILLIIFGMLDLGKAVVASKEDEIKKGQQLFIKRAIAAVVEFFVVQVVQIVVRFAAGSDSNTVIGCLNCFITGEAEDGACQKY